MVVIASPARVAAILAGTLWFALLLPGGASILESSVSATIANPIVSVAALTKIQPLLAQADDLQPHHRRTPSSQRHRRHHWQKRRHPLCPATLGTPVTGPGMAANTCGSLGTTLSNPPTAPPSPPVFGSNIPADGPGWTGAGNGEHRARASSGQPFRKSRHLSFLRQSVLLGLCSAMPSNWVDWRW
jgi:hypothetical protein